LTKNSHSALLRPDFTLCAFQTLSEMPHDSYFMPFTCKNILKKPFVWPIYSRGKYDQHFFTWPKFDKWNKQEYESKL